MTEHCFGVRFTLVGVLVVELSLDPAMKDLDVDVVQSTQIPGKGICRKKSATQRGSAGGVPAATLQDHDELNAPTRPG